MRKAIYSTKICEFCNKDFTVKQTNKRDFAKRFCNQACSSSYTGINNKGRKRSEEFKQNLSERNTGKNKF
jgi:hypothetical protein